MTVLLLTGFLATILMRVLKHDFIKYTNNVRDDEALEDGEETGWKVGAWRAGGLAGQNTWARFQQQPCQGMTACNL